MTSQITPTVGRTVLFYSATANFNGGSNKIAPAIVTRQWGSTPGSCINVKVLPDCEMPFDATSLFTYDSIDEGLAAGQQRFCYWPPRA